MLKDIQEILEQAVDTQEAAGVSLLAEKNGKTVAYAQAGYADREKAIPLRRDHIFRLFSQTKPVTACAVMSLIEKGKLDVMDEVVRYLPGFRNQKVTFQGTLVDAERNVTILDLLGMASGLVYPDADSAGQAMAEVFIKNEEEIDRGKGLDTQSFANRIGQCPLAFQPGTAFRYGTSADILGAVVEKVSDMPFSEYLKTRFFDRLGMKDTAFYVPEEKKERLVTCYERTDHGLVPYRVHHLCIRDYMTPPPFESGGAGLFSTLDDYAAFARMLMQKGSFEGQRLLKEKTVDWMIRSQMADTGWLSLTGYGYGRLMRICTDPGKTQGIAEYGEYGWDGWLGTYFANFPESGLTLLIYQNTRDTGTGRVTRVVRNRILSELCEVKG